MKRIVWLTDLHLEFLNTHEIHTFGRSVAQREPEAVLIGGDTGIAREVGLYLRALEHQWQCPIYFVLGNHDFYHGSIAQMRGIASQLTRNSHWLHWLPMMDVVGLTPNTGLIGHDGWGDGCLGNGARSQITLNDFSLIAELSGLSTHELFAKLHDLGGEAAQHFRRVLPEALKHFHQLIVLTHVPPFKEACWHEGHISDDEYLPHFTCKAVGDVLLEIMHYHPKHQLTVLCGHTHGQGEARILPNLYVKTGGAEYGKPCVQEVLHVE